MLSFYRYQQPSLHSADKAELWPWARKNYVLCLARIQKVKVDAFNCNTKLYKTFDLFEAVRLLRPAAPQPRGVCQTTAVGVRFWTRCSILFRTAPPAVSVLFDHLTLCERAPRKLELDGNASTRRGREKGASF